MFKIENGRLSFYQWDTNQRLIIEDASITEVHFCNKTSDCSLVCAVYEEDSKRLVDVPNILLQEDWTISVFAYSGNCTRYEESFIVYSRTKPDSYIYTETEIKSFELLEKRIEALESGAGGGAVDLTGYATEEYVKEAISNVPGYYDFVVAPYFTMKQQIADYSIKTNYPQYKMDLELAKSLPSITYPSENALGVFATNLKFALGTSVLKAQIEMVIAEFENMKANGVFSGDMVMVALGSEGEATHKVTVERYSTSNHTHRINLQWSNNELKGDIRWDDNTKTVYSHSIKMAYIDDTLKVSNKYADAKAVGNRFTEIEEKVASLEEALNLLITQYGITNK